MKLVENCTMQKTELGNLAEYAGLKNYEPAQGTLMSCKFRSNVDKKSDDQEPNQMALLTTDKVIR